MTKTITLWHNVTLINVLNEKEIYFNIILIRPDLLTLGITLFRPNHQWENYSVSLSKYNWIVLQTAFGKSTLTEKKNELFVVVVAVVVVVEVVVVVF